MKSDASKRQGTRRFKKILKSVFKGNFTLSRVIGFLVLIVITAIMLLPPIFMVSTSLKNTTEMLIYPPAIIPKDIAFSNFITIFKDFNLGMYYKNSLIISILAVIGTVLSSAFAAFGFARYSSKWKKPLFTILLGTMMLPYPVTMVPQFLIFRQLGWIDTFLPLIVPAFLGSAFMIFLLKQFYSSLPDELFEAAKIDGCGEIQQWWKIAVPLCAPALATVAIFTFLWTWDDLLGAVIYLNSQEKFTLPIALSSMTTARRMIPWNMLMAGSILAVIPGVSIFFFAQKYFVQGIVITGLK